MGGHGEMRPHPVRGLEFREKPCLHRSRRREEADSLGNRVFDPPPHVGGYFFHTAQAARFESFHASYQDD